MVGNDLVLTLLSCTFFMGLVAWVSYLKTRGEVSTKDGYFLAGRGLGAVFIAGSMLLTNLSAEQLIGLNGSAYGFNLSSMGWEVTAAVATIAMAVIFLPRFLAGAFSTLPNSSTIDSMEALDECLLFCLWLATDSLPFLQFSTRVRLRY